MDTQAHTASTDADHHIPHGHHHHHHHHHHLDLDDGNASQSVVSTPIPASFVVCATPVLTWGANDYGQLGTGDTDDRAHPTIVHVSDDVHHCADVVAACGGGGHAAVLLACGDLLVAGKNDCGQLALGDDVPRTVFTRVPRGVWAHAMVKWVECGWAHTMVVDDNGRVFGSGCNRYGQLGLGRDAPRSASTLTLLHSLPPVTRVHCGMRHTLAITRRGGLMGWGSNRCGQLGCKPSREPLWSPRLITGHDDKSSGADGVDDGTRATVTDDSRADGCRAGGGGGRGDGRDGGCSDRGDCGGGGSRADSGGREDGGDAIVTKDCDDVKNHETTVAADDSTVDEKDSEYVKAVVKAAAAGANHTAFITSDGVVWCCGSNKFQQCGPPVVSVRDNCVWPPHRMTSIGTADAVACGWTHTVAVVWRTGRVWTWGRNNFGQLGNCSADDESHGTPAMAALDAKCVEVCTGSEHTVAMDDQGRLWAWGWNEHGILGCAPYANSTSGIGEDAHVHRDTANGDDAVDRGHCEDDSAHDAGSDGRAEGTHTSGGRDGRGGADTSLDTAPYNALPSLVSFESVTTVRTFGCGAGFTVVVCGDDHRHRDATIDEAIVSM